MGWEGGVRLGFKTLLLLERLSPGGRGGRVQSGVWVRRGLRTFCCWRGSAQVGGGVGCKAGAGLG